MPIKCLWLQSVSFSFYLIALNDLVYNSLNKQNSEMPSEIKITKIEIVKIEYGLEDVEADPTIGIPIYLSLIHI